MSNETAGIVRPRVSYHAATTVANTFYETVEMESLTSEATDTFELTACHLY